MSEATHLYLVMAMRNPTFQAEAGQAHQTFLAGLIERGELDMTGPFTDGAGGAYLLRTASLDEATRIAHADPLHITGSSTLTVHEWRIRRFPEA